MKKFFLLVFVIGILLPFKAAAWKELDYSHSSNWVICEKNIRKNCEVDIFLCASDNLCGQKQCLYALARQ